MGKYDDLFGPPDDSARAGMALRFGIETNANEAAKADLLARRYGVPTGVIQQYRPDYEARSKVEDAMSKLEQSPKLRGWLAENVNNASMAQNDIANLASTERTFAGTIQDIGVVGLKLTMGVPKMLVGLGNIPTFGYYGKALESIGLDFNEAEKIAETFYSPAQQAANKRVRSEEGFLPTLEAGLRNPSVIATTVGESLGQMLAGGVIGRGLMTIGNRAVSLTAGGVGPTLPGVLTRTFGDKAPMIAAALGEGIAGAGSAAEQIRSQTPERTLNLGQVAAALATGGGTAGLAYLGGATARKFGLADLDTMIVKGGTDAVIGKQIKQSFMKSIVGSGISEGFFEELPQSMQEQMWQNAALDQPIMEGVGNAAALGLLAGAATGGAVGGFSTAMSRMETRREAAQKQSQFIANLNAEAGANAMRKVNPAAYEQYVQNLAEGTNVENMYVDVDQFANVLRQSNISIDQLAQTLPEVAKQIAEALPGSDITIPTSQYAARLAGTDLGNALAQHIRVDPDLPSAAEAAIVEQQRDQMIKNAAALMEEKRTTDRAFVQSAKVVEQRMFDQIKATGQYTDSVSRTNAQFVRDFVVTQAAALRMTPEAFYDRYMYKVEKAGQQAAGDVYNQQGQLVINTPEFKAWFGDSKVVDAEGKPLVVYHGTRADFTEFKPSRVGAMGPGIYFSKKPDVASSYSDVTTRKGQEGGGNQVMPVYLSVKNPLVIDSVNDSSEQLFKRIDPTGKLSDDEVIAKLIEQGYDAVYAKEDDEWVVFDPTQIKSAIGNIGTFDPNDPNILRQAAQVATGRPIFQDIISALGLTDEEVNATAIEYMTGLPGDMAFMPPAVGGLPDVVEFIYQRRMESGLPVLDINKSEDRAQLARLVAAEALAAIRNAGDSLEWYDTTVAKTLAMMAVKHPELATDVNARNAFLIATAITSQGLNVEDNLAFASEQYKAFRRDGKFPLAGKGESSGPMVTNFQKANDLLEEMGPDLFRQFLVTPFTVRELETAGFPIGGENKDTMVLGSAIFGPKIGFGFYSNLNGNFEPVTMDMWFMRTIGRLAGTLPAFEQDKYDKQVKRFRDAFKERGPKAKGLYASQLDKDLINAAKTDDGKLIELARLVNKIHNRDFKVNRAKFDDKTRIKTDLVAAAQTILISLEKPRDVPASGGERNLLRDIVSQVVDIVAEQYGSRVPPAALQALIWYPEQELYKAMGVKLRVTSQDYAGAARKLLEGEGYDGNQLDIAAQLGSAAVRPSNAAAIAAAIQGNDQGLRQARPLEADERTRFLVERNRRIVEEQRAAAARVNFEVAPDPNNVALVERWRALTQEQRLEISLRVANEVVPKVLKGLKFKGEILPQTGSYLNDTNPSFAIRLDKGDAAELSKVLGFVLAQDSMMAIASDEFAGSFKTRAFRIAIGEKTTQEIEQIYNTLRAITMEGKQPIGGQSTSGGVMTILLDSDTNVDVLSTLVNTALGNAYDIGVAEVFAAFPDKQEYDYANPENDPSGDEGVVRQRARDARAQATEALRRELDATAAGEGTLRQAELGEQSQVGAQQARGGFDPTRLTTILNEKTDLSTFLHETAHFFLTVYADMAAQPNATEQMKADMQTLLDWFGVKDLATWNGMSLEEQRKYHERFAYSYELYLFEGKAPSVKLQTMFEKFSAWLRRTYKSIRDDLNAIYRQEHGEDLPILTGEVRQVMDRMLASQDQIQEAEKVRNMVPMFQSQEQSGMDDAQWAAYQEMLNEAHEAAVTDLTKASMRQMKWLQNARSRILKDLQKQADTQRKEVKAEVTDEVMERPERQAEAYLKREGGQDPTRNDAINAWKAQREEAAAKMAEEVKTEYLAKPEADGLKGIQKGQYLARVKREMANETQRRMLAWEKSNPRPVMSDSGYDVIAELFGFSSGDELRKKLAVLPSVKDEIDAITDERMLEKYGDLSNPASIELAIESALHNEARARFVAVELRFMAKATQPVRLMLQAAKMAARATILGRVVSQVRPKDFVAAEARAARQATDLMKKGDSMGAAQAKQAQLLQNQLAAEAVKVRQQIDKDVAYLRKVTSDANRKRIGADAADQIDDVLERFDLGALTRREAAERADLRAWVESQREAGYEPEIAPEILKQAFRLPYTNLTVQQFQDLVDAVRQVEAIGRNEQRMISQSKAVAYAAARDEIVASINDNARGRTAEARTPTTNAGRLAQSIKGFFAEHLKAAIISRILDGGKDGGPMWKYLISTANDRGNMETTMRAKATEDMTRIMAPILANGTMGGKGTYFPSVKRSFNKESVVAIAANWGNDGNRQRLLDGEGWTVDQVMPILQTLTADEWRSVQQLWDYFESYRPKIAEKERRVYGKEPNWIEPSGFTIQTVYGDTINLKGGYYPVKYDPQASERAEAFEEAEEAKRMMRGAFTSATTKRSFTKARVEKVVGRPLLYTLDGMYSGINDVIHDLAWHEWLIDANKLMRSQSIDEAIRTQYGPEWKQQLKKWVQDVAVGEQPAQGFGDRSLGWIRQSVSMAGLGFNVMSAMQQITGFSSSIVRIGTKWVGYGIGKTIGDMSGSFVMVNDKSSFMANRSRTQFRELNELRNQIRGQNPVQRTIQLGAYFMMMRMQRLVDVPTWIGAYEKAVAEGRIDTNPDGSIDDSVAVGLADQAVIDSQGSGMVKDLSKIERYGQAVKLFTVFYSYMNTQFNLAVAESMTEQSKGKLAAKYSMLLIAPVVLTYALKAALTPGGDDDKWEWEKLSRSLAAEQLSYLMGMMVVVRELSFSAKIMFGTEGGNRDYSGPAGLRMISDIGSLTKQAVQGEFDTAFRKSAINLLGDFTGLPSAQINRTINGIEALAEGQTQNPAAVMLGYDKPK